MVQKPESLISQEVKKVPFGETLVLQDSTPDIFWWIITFMTFLEVPAEIRLLDDEDYLNIKKEFFRWKLPFYKEMTPQDH